MKKIYFILLFVSVTFLQAQKFVDKNLQVTRIPLKEKFNSSARVFPKLLIRSFCEGKIKGYYPQKPTVECSYHEFAAHFDVKKTQPSVKGDTFEEVDCPQSFCANKDESSIEPFTLYFDVIEDKGFAQQTSTTKYNIKFIRLVYAFEKHGMDVYYSGPLFVYEDIVKLEGDDLFIMNPKNDNAKVKFKQYLEERMFTGFPLSADNVPPKRTNPNQEKDKWEH